MMQLLFLCWLFLKNDYNIHVELLLIIYVCHRNLIEMSGGAVWRLWSVPCSWRKV